MKNKLLSLGRVLSKSQLKTINGGSGTCAYYNGEWYVENLSYSEVQGMLSGPNDHWCCDSCGSASWLPQRIKKVPNEPT
ncbi:hypothetical protein [Winogradskyella sp. PE311]|uniref:hypothetical protein n=1 Tax=Winogradskyella sp. PE311 TaxID=3366943 RepID=UPI0039806EE6